MVLDSHRSKADIFLVPFAKRMTRINPNLITLLSLLFAFFAGICFYYSSNKVYLIYATLLILVTSYFDALDGKIARIQNKITKKGDFLDHTTDRYADVFILFGILASPYCNELIGAFALVGVLLTSYMGTQAQAMGLKRHYGGILGRADRLVILMIIPNIHYAIITQNPTFPESLSAISFLAELTIIEWMMIYFAVGGNITALQRVISIWKELKN